MMRGPQRAPRTVIDRALVILVALMWIAVALTWQAARWNIQKAQKEASNPDQRAQAQKGDWWEESMAGKQKAKEVAAAKAAAAKEAGYDSQITIGRSGREYGGVNSGEGGSRYAARATVGGDLGDRLSLGGDELEDYARQDVAVVDNTKRRRMKASTGDGHSDRSRIWHPVTEDDDIQDVPIDVRSIKRIRRRTDMDGEVDWPIEVRTTRRVKRRGTHNDINSHSLDHSLGHSHGDGDGDGDRGSGVKAHGVGGGGGGGREASGEEEGGSGMVAGKRRLLAEEQSGWDGGGGLEAEAERGRGRDGGGGRGWGTEGGRRGEQEAESGRGRGINGGDSEDNGLGSHGKYSFRVSDDSTDTMGEILSLGRHALAASEADGVTSESTQVYPHKVALAASEADGVTIETTQEYQDRHVLAASVAHGKTGLQESRGASVLGESGDESREWGRRLTDGFLRRGSGDGEGGVEREAVAEREEGRMVDRVEYLREVILGFDTSGIKGLEEVREEVKGRHLVFAFEEEVSSDDVAPASVISRTRERYTISD
ncbi:unnamed protein product [Closterium sp. NIES-54]